MKKIKYLGLIVIMLIALTGCGDKKEEIKKDTILLKEDLKFEVNSEVNLLSMISEDNKVKVLSEDETIDIGFVITTIYCNIFKIICSLIIKIIIALNSGFDFFF